MSEEALSETEIAQVRATLDALSAADRDDLAEMIEHHRRMRAVRKALKVFGQVLTGLFALYLLGIQVWNSFLGKN